MISVDASAWNFDSPGSRTAEHSHPWRNNSNASLQTHEQKSSEEEDLWGDQASDYWEAYLSPTDSEEAIKFIDALEFPNGMRALDLGCANGRVAIPLALKGAQVVAVDNSPKMLRALRVSADLAGAVLESVEDDIAQLSTRRKFDLILLLDSTLNMLDPERQEACIRGCAERLDNDGLLLIQCYNATPRIFSGEAVYGVTEHEDGTVVARIFRLDDGIRLSGSIYIVPTEGSRTRICSKTVPIRHETLIEMLERAGLKVMHRYADWDSSDPSDGSTQSIYIVGQSLEASSR